MINNQILLNTGDQKMIREIIKPKSDEYLLHIPPMYINKEIEILVFPLDIEEKKTNSKNNFNQLSKKTAGLLAKRKVDPIKWQQKIRNEWGR